MPKPRSLIISIELHDCALTIEDIESMLTSSFQTDDCTLEEMCVQEDGSKRGEKLKPLASKTAKGKKKH